MYDNELYEKMLNSCELCARRCKVNRHNNELGYCEAGALPVAARASVYNWEEPCISGVRGSGAVFFSNCSLKCVFCQNREISSLKKGMTINEDRLCEIYLALEKKGAENINLVTPTHFILPIVKSVFSARKRGLNIPVVYNTASYETPEALSLVKDAVDIYLADTKFFSSDISGRYCNAPDYFKVCRQAVTIMFENAGKLVFDEEGMLKKGVILRLLLLPGQLNDAKEILNRMFDLFGNDVIYSLMNQYTPFGELEAFPELKKSVRSEDYDKLIDYAISLGVENGYIQQEGTCSESFIPAFDFEGIKKE